MTMSLTAAIIIELAFKKILETSAGELSKKFTLDAIAKMDELRQKIQDKFTGDSRAETAINAIADGSTSEIPRLEVYLEDLMRDEPEFANQLQLLAQEINAGKLQDNSKIEQNNYDNSTGFVNKVEGGIANIANNMTIIQNQPDD